MSIGGKILSRAKSWLVGNSIFLISLLAIAATYVTAAQVADAIRNSPSASPWLRANADAVGRLAMFESSGRLDIYNNSCCYGVLQMNTRNIERFANTTPADFMTWDLQRQVDAWSQLTSTALNSAAPRTLAGLGTFDGRTVDGDLVLACVQLGIGNCQRMINSGSCSGFADINGTTICGMADRIRGGTGNPSPGGSGSTSSGSSSSGTSFGGTYTPPANPCVRDADGSCMSITASLEQGFLEGSGVPMRDMRVMVFAASVALVIMVTISLMSGLWRNYASGAIDKAALMLHSKKAILIILAFYTAMSMF